MAKFTIIVTRDVTESCVVTVSAANAAEAEAKALEFIYNHPQGANWEPDDCTGGDPYTTDITQE